MISIFYHCWLGEKDQGVNILAEQMDALIRSGLSAEANTLFICGQSGDVLLAAAIAPENATMHSFGVRVFSELPTLALLREWAHDFPEDQILYFHTKGASHPSDVYHKWRRCMERAVIWNWRECVQELDRGADTVGTHWMTHRKYSMVGADQRYWGGNFWWAKAQYVNLLPPLPADSPNDRYDSEVWIGKACRPPIIHDFAPHWPMSGCR